MCDDCYDADYSFRCGLCESRESNDYQGLATVVGSMAPRVGLTPGIYQIVRWPFYSSDYISERVFRSALIRVGDAPEHADEGGEYLCRACTIKAIVRRTRSGRWRVTTVYWSRGWWQTKTWVYRTRSEATRRARVYVEVPR